MRTTPTDEERERYAENGYLVVEEFLDRDELEHWRTVVDVALARRGAQRFSFATGAEATSCSRPAAEQSYYDRVFTQRVNLWQTDATMKTLMINPVIGKLACDLTGVDGMRVWHDQALIKLPFANPTGYHLDVPYWSFTSADAITIWIVTGMAVILAGVALVRGGTAASRLPHSKRRAQLEVRQQLTPDADQDGEIENARHERLTGSACRLA